MYYTEELSEVVESICIAMKSLCEKAEEPVDPDEIVRGEICYFILYLISENGIFDNEEYEIIEQAVKFRTDRTVWDETIKLFRADSEENYLSRPPETIDFLVQADNTFYDMGLELACVDTIMSGFKAIGEIVVNGKGFLDERRNHRLTKFIEMVDKYQKDNTKNPAGISKMADGEEERVIPSKKGVSAPKKS